MPPGSREQVVLVFRAEEILNAEFESGAFALTERQESKALAAKSPEQVTSPILSFSKFPQEKHAKTTSIN